MRGALVDLVVVVLPVFCFPKLFLYQTHLLFSLLVSFKGYRGNELPQRGWLSRRPERMLLRMCMCQRERERERERERASWEGHWVLGFRTRRWCQVGDMYVCLYQELMETGWGRFSAQY